MKRRRGISIPSFAWVGILFAGIGFRVFADCASFGLPFVDLGSEPGFCAAIAEAYYAGITNGTTPTTFSPDANVTRAQAAAFATRTLDAVLTRGSRRAALAQWWTTKSLESGLGIMSTGSNMNGLPASDGTDIWVPIPTSGYPSAVVAQQSSVRPATTVSLSDSVERVRASDGRVLEVWTGAVGATAALVALGRVFVTGASSLYMIDPSQTAGPVTSVAAIPGPGAIAFDGSKIWTTSISGPSSGSISVITPGASLPWSSSTLTTDVAVPAGILYEGNNIWVADAKTGALDKLDADGTILQSISLPPAPIGLTFDGTNIWVANEGPGPGSVSVVRASSGAVVGTLTGNGLSSPTSLAFDGRRILVLSRYALSLFDAATLQPLGFVSTVITGLGFPSGVCSDGINFWITFQFSMGGLARF